MLRLLPSLAPVPVPVFAPAEAGSPLASPSGAAAESPLDGEVLSLGLGLGLSDGDDEGGGVVLWLEVGVVGTIGAPVGACPGLYGRGLGGQDRELPEPLAADR